MKRHRIDMNPPYVGLHNALFLAGPEAECSWVAGVDMMPFVLMLCHPTTREPLVTTKPDGSRMLLGHPLDFSGDPDVMGGVFIEERR